jgi:hypothetical protein
LNGNYPTAESVTTSGAIYSIGGASYLPGTTTLGTMYGVGYAYSGSGRAVGTNPAGAPIDTWGLYGASAGVLNWFLDTNVGSGYFNNRLSAPIFYDSNNTAYYLDPASGSNLNAINAARFSAPNSGLLSVGDDSATETINDGSTRSRVYVSSSYPVITINSTITSGNDNHGGTLQFTHNGYSSNRQWVIGTPGTGAQLDFGTSANAADKNPHNGIAGYQGVTMMRMTTAGNVGIGGDWGLYGSTGGSPSYPLHVVGIGYSDTSLRAPIFYDSNDTAYYVDPNGTSNINALQTAGQVVIGGTFSNNAYNAVSSTRLLFGGGNDADNYSIGTSLNNYGGNYTKLDLRWHTGIRMGAQPGYGGIRFFDSEDFGTQIFSVGETDTHVRVNNNLYAGIMYDINDTGYYVNPNSGTNLKYLQVSGAWGSSPFGSASEQFTIRTNYPSYTHRNTETGGYWLVHHALDNTINWYGGTTGGVDASAWNRNLFLDMSGNLTARGNITAYSDFRLKTNIVTIDNALDKIKRLRGVYFDWIESGEHSLGMIAQEVEEVLPELVMTNTECKTFTQEVLNVTKSLDYSKIVSVLVEAVKEQQKQIEEQNKRIAFLENK